MENHGQAAEEHRPAFTGEECNCLLRSHFKDQPSTDRSTLSEIASASASERGFSIHGSLLLAIEAACNGLPFLIAGAINAASSAASASQRSDDRISLIFFNLCSLDKVPSQCWPRTLKKCFIYLRVEPLVANTSFLNSGAIIAVQVRRRRKQRIHLQPAVPECHALRK
jgi:hypothetical protein